MDNLWITIDFYPFLDYTYIVVTEEQGTGLDMTARGQIAKTWIYYVVNGYQRRRTYAVPNDPQSPRQLSKRAFWRNGAEWWKNEDQEFRNYYSTTVKNLSLAMTGYDLFMQDWTKGVYVTEVVKSIQKGTKACNAGANDVAIGAVETAKSIVIVPAYWCGSALGAPNECGINGGELTSGTNLRIHAIKGAAAGQPNAYWQVIEFY